jgi:hypothetical protein
MVCYICNNPASTKCPECNRYVCAKHTCSWGEYICSNCYNGKQALSESIQEKIKKGRRCDFCGKVVDNVEIENFYEVESLDFIEVYSRLPKCHICKRSYCSKHGQIVSISMLHPNIGYWYRCIDHLKKPGILGRHKLTGFFETVFIGEPDREKSGY